MTLLAVLVKLCEYHVAKLVALHGGTAERRFGTSEMGAKCDHLEKHYDVIRGRTKFNSPHHLRLHMCDS